MHRLIPPLCLLLALAMLIAGFAVWAVEPPEAGVDLHKARAVGDEDYQDVLEARLAQHQWARTLLVGGLFAGCVLMTVVAFLSMRE